MNDEMDKLRAIVDIKDRLADDLRYKNTDLESRNHKLLIATKDVDRVTVFLLLAY